MEDVPESNDNLRDDNGFDASEFVPVERVPDKFRNIFANYLCFNKIQSAVFNDVFETDASLVVSAPTGSGKTVVFELAICRLIKKYDLHQMEYNFMIVYVAPIKALCEERVLDWHRKFSPLGINCTSVTGDSDVFSVQHLSNHNLIITTPEKWDSLTRRWRHSLAIMNRVALFMIDEVHLLNDEQRGPTLEAIMSRMKTIEDSKKDNLSAELLQSIRFLAISATIPNVQDIAEWIGTRRMPSKYFNDEVRPVKLNKIVMGYYYNPQMSTPFKFDILLSYKLQSIILQYSNGKPTLIFCSTRKSVEMTTKHLSQNLTITLNGSQKAILLQAASEITTPAIKEILIHGVGSHHAGMLPESRRIMETLFRNGDLPILVTTSTLAMGINLPAHLVIIKSTKYYTNGEYRDYSESILFQMIGRAGRPQFDTFATAVILTTTIDKPKFENMLGGTQNVESSLHKHLTEHLNAEIVLRTITDREVAKQWLNSTFLHIRARKHPTHYGFSANLSHDQLDRKLMEMCEIEINKLERVGMIEIQDTNIIPTEIGSLMAKYCIHFSTMKLFKEVQGTEVLQQILALVSKCHEFSDLYLRVNDKKTLNLLNKCKNRETIRFPFIGKIKTLDMKINCIVQAVFGCLQILEPSLINEAQKIMKIGERLSKCLADYINTRGNGFSALLNALILAKCFHCRIWENSPYVSRQLPGIGAVMSAHLVLAGKTTFQSILETNPRNLEMIIHRKPPMGDSIITAVDLLPKYIMHLEEEKCSSVKSKVRVFIQLVNSEKLENELTIDAQSYMDLVIGDDDNNILLHDKISHNYMIDNKEIEKVISKEFMEPTTIMAHFISENWAGIDCTATLEINTTILDKSTKQNKNTQKKTANTTKPKPSKKIEQPIIPTETENPLVKNFINQYFKTIKKIKTPEMSPILNTVKADIDENNLLESEQDDISNWEPLDENLLNSSDEQRIDTYINECESDQITYGENRNTTKVYDSKNTGENINSDSTLATNELNYDLLNDGYEEEFCTEFFTQDVLSNDNLKEVTPKTTNETKKKKFQFKRTTNKENILNKVGSFEDVFSDEMVCELNLADVKDSNGRTQTCPESKKSQVLTKSNNGNVLRTQNANQKNCNKTNESQEKQQMDTKQNKFAEKVGSQENQTFKTKMSVDNNQNKYVNKQFTTEIPLVNERNVTVPLQRSSNKSESQEKSTAAPIIEQLRGLIANKNNTAKNENSTSDLNSISEKDEEFEYSEDTTFNSFKDNQSINKMEEDISYSENEDHINQYEEAKKRMKQYEEENASVRKIQNITVLNNSLISGRKSNPKENQKPNMSKAQRFINDQRNEIIIPTINQAPLKRNTTEQMNLGIPLCDQASLQRFNDELINPGVDQPALQNRYLMTKSITPGQMILPKMYNDKLMNQGIVSPSNQANIRRCNEKQMNNRIIPSFDQLYSHGSNEQQISHQFLNNQRNPIHNRNETEHTNILKFNNRSHSGEAYHRINVNNKPHITEGLGSNFMHEPNQFPNNRQQPEQFISNRSTPNQYIINEHNPNLITCEAQSSNMTNKRILKQLAVDEHEAVFSNDLSSISECDEVEEMEDQIIPKPAYRVESFMSDVRDLSASSCAKLNSSFLGNRHLQQRSASGESLRSYSGMEIAQNMRSTEPALESFSNLFQQRKKKMFLENTMNFEKSAIQGTSGIRNFAYTPKKKISHTITSNSLREENEKDVPQKRVKPNDYSQSSNDKKSIKWRSPLIVSPKYKYSPKNIERGKFNIFPQRSEIHSTSEIIPTQAQQRMTISQPTRISFAQNPFTLNPQPHRNTQSESQSLYNQQPRSKITKRRSALGTISLNTPKNLQQLPVTDQDCGYSQSTQHVEIAQRRCNELNNFLFNPSMEIFKPEANFVENDIANYVRQNQPPLQIKDDEIAQEWWNLPDSTEQQVKDQVQRELREIINKNNFLPSDDYENLNQSQSNCCNHCTPNFNYQPSDVIPESQPPYYPGNFNENYARTQWEYEQQMRWDEVNRRRMPPQAPNTESTGYNMENRWDLMQRYLHSQTPQSNFRNK